MNKKIEIKKAVDSIVKAYNPIIAEIIKRFESMLESNDLEDKETLPLNIVIEKTTKAEIKEITISLHLSDTEGYILHKTTEFLNIN